MPVVMVVPVMQHVGLISLTKQYTCLPSVLGCRVCESHGFPHRCVVLVAWRGVELQGMSEEEIAAELTPSPDDPQPLTADEQEERAALLAEGFASWNRRDFMVGTACGRRSTLTIIELGGSKS